MRPHYHPLFHLTYHRIPTLIKAIALFLSTELGYEESWLTKLNIDKSDELILYVYSFYLGSTTVFTVGYGDIVPKNTVEVVLIIIIQILGIALIT